MCTGIYLQGEKCLFGRTLDLEKSYGERVVITPRAYAFRFLHEMPISCHSAVIGTACVWKDVPLYYDALNEHGLAMAALNFPDCAHYHAAKKGKHNVASHELIPWVLGQCKTVARAKELLSQTNVTADSVDAALPATPLHWMIADRETCMVAEATTQGLCLYDNPVGVMTNAPTFTYHMARLADYMRLEAMPPENRLCPTVALSAYTRGLGAMGLPGDWSSVSRFVRAVYARYQTVCADAAEQEVERFFRIMDTVSVPNGCVRTETGAPVKTLYTGCMDMTEGAYHYHTYADRAIRTVRLRECDLSAQKLVVYPMASCDRE